MRQESNTMKGVILAGGSGTELQPLTSTVPKPMIRILDKPLIEYAVERLVQNGIDNIIVVIGKDGKIIQDYLKDGKDFNAHIKYQQQEISGIDGAILAVHRYFKPTDRFVLTHSDIIVDPKIITRALNAAENTGSDMAIAVTLQSEIQDFGQVELDAEGLVSKTIPPGETVDGNYVVAGTFVLTGKIFEYLAKNQQFNLCFNEFINDGGEVAGAIWNETWIDVGRPWDILRASYYLLERIRTTKISIDAVVEPNVEIKGAVVIESGATILNGTVINGPVYIGRNAYIGNNSLIRDRSAIYDNAKIGMGVEIRSSVIMEAASIARLSYVGASIVGQMATMHSGAITINTKTPPAPITSMIGTQEITVPLNKFGAVIGPESHIGVHTSLKPGTIVGNNVIIQPHQVISGVITSK